MNCLIVGNGNWGQKLAKNLEKFATVKKKINSSIDYRKLKLKKIDWVFISTPNNLHYEQVKYFLKKKVNVFCEKPITLESSKTKELIELSYKNSVKLYIDEIESFKNKRLSISKKNLIFRSKLKHYSFRELLYALFYHDFYLLKNQISLKSVQINILKNSNLKKIFSITSRNFLFLFHYEIKKKKKHFINKVNFITKKNYIRVMLHNVFKNRVNFKENHENALFCNLLIEIILKEYKRTFNANTLCN
jgi:hypothetical protein